LRHCDSDVVLFPAKKVVARRRLRAHGLSLLKCFFPLLVEGARVALVLAEDIGSDGEAVS